MGSRTLHWEAIGKQQKHQSLTCALRVDEFFNQPGTDQNIPGYC